MHIGLILSIVVYMAILLLIGFLSYRRSVNSTDYILGGRSLNYWVTAISAHASDMSSWLFLAYPATIFLFGGWQIWIAIGLIAGMYLNWQFIAPRLRTETEKYGSMTLSHYFEHRFQDKTGILRTISAAPLLLFFSVYVSSGLVGMGYLFETVFNINYTVGITAALIVVITYVFIGGFTTICWIDLFQGLFLLAMIILVPLYTLPLVGSWEGISSAVTERGLSLSIFPQGTNAASSLMQILLLSLGWGLGYFGQPHILSKFMGIRQVSEMHKSKYVGISWQILSMAAATFVGIIAIAYFKNGIDSPQFAFVLIVKQLFHPFVAGMILCGILAATISTMDSQILILASVLSEDFYHRFIRKNSSQKEVVWTSRIAVIVIAIIAYSIAISTESTINTLVQYGWAGLGSTFGSVLVLSLYSKRVNLYGAITGVLFGGIVAAIWPYINTKMSIEIPSLIPGFLLNLLVIYVVSILTNGNNAEAQRSLHKGNIA